MNLVIDVWMMFITWIVIVVCKFVFLVNNIGIM